MKEKPKPSLDPVTARGRPPPATEHVIQTATLAGVSDGTNQHNLLDCYRIALDFGLVAARRALRILNANRIV
ncbi:MAG: hypothetical protein V3R83_12725 [Gammaproteobacteria bacterium]